MRVSRCLPALLALSSSCVGVPLPAAAPPLQEEVWVDASTVEPGDGSLAHPWKELPDALKSRPGPLRVHLRAGLYRGPFTLDPGVALVGHGLAVLYAEGPEPVVSAPGPVSLEHLTLQGGAGAQFGQGAHLLQVEISGAKPVSLRVSGGTSDFEGVTLSASFSETVGLQLEGGAFVRCAHCSVQGPFRRGATVDGEARLQLEDSQMNGPVTGLQLGFFVARRTA